MVASARPLAHSRTVNLVDTVGRRPTLLTRRKTASSGSDMQQARPAVLSTFGVAAARPERTLALVVLTAVGTVNFVDRQILSVLVEPIRRELHFSDTQFGLLTGLSFALFYALLGVPAAVLSDRTHPLRLVPDPCLLSSL